MATSEDALAAVRDRIARAVVERGIPSMAIAASHHGKIVLEDAFGWADRSARRGATPHTPYAIASITKPITATALLVLVERGLVDLDRPIESYLRGVRVNGHAGSAEEVTVRRVASHQAGLPLHYQFFYDDETFERPPMAETARRYANIVTPPGERYLYSNLGYGLLDHLITEVSGMPYAEFVRREVLVPLGMHRSAVGLDAALRPHAAAGYGADGVAYPSYDFDHPGGSAVFASAHDLLRFAMWNVGTPLPDQRPILGSELLALAHQAAVRSPVGFGYGLGWMTTDDEAGFLTRGHTGGMGGVSTAMAIVPSEEVAVVVLANAHSPTTQWARIQLLSALLPAYGARKAEAGATILRQATPIAEPVPDDLRRSLVGSWRGAVETFAGPVPVTFDVGAEEIIVTVGDNLRTLLDQVRWDGSRLHGVVAGDLGTGDTRGRPSRLVFDLARRDGDVIDGCVTQLTDLGAEDGGAVGRRAGNALSHWVRLARAAP